MIDIIIVLVICATIATIVTTPLREGYVFAWGIACILVIAVVLWDQLSLRSAEADCRDRRAVAEQSARAVPYVTTTLCSHGFATLPGWSGWSCGCAP